MRGNSVHIGIVESQSAADISTAAQAHPTHATPTKLHVDSSNLEIRKDPLEPIARRDHAAPPAHPNCKLIDAILMLASRSESAPQSPLARRDGIEVPVLQITIDAGMDT